MRKLPAIQAEKLRLRNLSIAGGRIAENREAAEREDGITARKAAKSAKREDGVRERPSMDPGSFAPSDEG
jgi:hypothetical protein